MSLAADQTDVLHRSESAFRVIDISTDQAGLDDPNEDGNQDQFIEIQPQRGEQWEILEIFSTVFLEYTDSMSDVSDQATLYAELSENDRAELRFTDLQGHGGADPAFRWDDDGVLQSGFYITRGPLAEGTDGRSPGQFTNAVVMEWSPEAGDYVLIGPQELNLNCIASGRSTFANSSTAFLGATVNVAYRPL